MMQRRVTIGTARIDVDKIVTYLGVTGKLDIIILLDIKGEANTLQLSFNTFSEKEKALEELDKMFP